MLVENIYEEMKGRREGPSSVPPPRPVAKPSPKPVSSISCVGFSCPGLSRGSAGANRGTRAVGAWPHEARVWPAHSPCLGREGMGTHRASVPPGPWARQGASAARVAPGIAGPALRAPLLHLFLSTDETQALVEPPPGETCFCGT